VTTVDALMDCVLPLEFLERHIFSLKEGEETDLSGLLKKLSSLGYERCGQVEAPGQFALRGGILDVFSLTEDAPVRIEFWGDEIDSIRSFDVQSQRSIENLKEFVIYPAAELILDENTLAGGIAAIEKEKKKTVKAFQTEGKREAAARLGQMVEEFRENLSAYGNSMGLDSYIHYFFGKDVVSFLDYFRKKNTVIFLDEFLRIEEKAQAVELEFREGMTGRMEQGYILPSQADVLFSWKQIEAMLARRQLVLLSSLDAKIPAFSVSMKYDVNAKSVANYVNHFEMLIDDLKNLKKRGYRTVLISASRTRAMRLSEDLQNDYELAAFYSEQAEELPKPGEIMVIAGNLHHGFEYPLLKFIVVTDTDMFGAQKRKKKKKQYEGRAIQSFHDLNVGDFVVHENHGIGIYRGIEKIESEKQAKDYMKIEYGDGGILYVPAANFETVQKFAGSESKKPRLNKLNSREWKTTKARVRSAVKEVAADLVKLYAARQEKKGYQFSQDTVWQTEFEELFPYEETADQLTAIEATKKDMESSKIMDRLICGDVGFGKTEVAIRAAFKAVQDSKQVVYLVPTTILAQQHYNTFVQRMKDYPVRIEMMSRFRTPAQQKKAIAGLKSGEVDIVIGTHRLLSKDMQYKNLGLLIIDEEQRFGVAHKEKMKQMKQDIDVLSLSATPIPRTLHMSLVGIRDMSVLEEPPVDRLPIQTYVMEHNPEVIREAVNRELARGGQVYYVCNRVNSIAETANMVANLVPEANVAFAHGQMSERELEKIMFEFINGEIDVLVATTIIETGLDISNVNTMIIDNADQLGLSQLYQLRGRVGRSNRTAYAFLMYKRDKMLKEVAEKRLKAIREFTDLGSGFKIAMRDLEIRGAGSMLGVQQHGHMEAVGYDLYCKMLNDAVLALKGEHIEEQDDFETTVDLDMDAYIPAAYIKSEFQKLDMYKRIANVTNREELMDLQDELTDRFGVPGAAVTNLLMAAYLKSLAHQAWITQVTQRGPVVEFYFHPAAKLDISLFPDLIESYHGKLKLGKKKEQPFFIYTLEEKPAAVQVKKEGKQPQKNMAAAYRIQRNMLKRKEPVKQEQQKVQPQTVTGTVIDNETILKKTENFLLELGKLKL
jgi:transcription-repair coupling factor (superfamily II helicase)